MISCFILFNEMLSCLVKLFLCYDLQGYHNKPLCLLLVKTTNNHRRSDLEPTVKQAIPSEFICASLQLNRSVEISFFSLTSCVGAVCPAAEVVLQQLVCPGGAGSSHQPHCGLMEKHLQEAHKYVQVFVSGMFLPTYSTRHIHSSVEPYMHSLVIEHFPVKGLKQKLIKQSSLCGSQSVAQIKKQKNYHSQFVKAAVVKDPLATLMTTPVKYD